MSYSKYRRNTQTISFLSVLLFISNKMRILSSSRTGFLAWPKKKTKNSRLPRLLNHNYGLEMPRNTTRRASSNSIAYQCLPRFPSLVIGFKTLAGRPATIWCTSLYKSSNNIGVWLKFIQLHEIPIGFNLYEVKTTWGQVFLQYWISYGEFSA